MKITAESSTIFISNEIDKILTEVSDNLKWDKIFVLVDENTKQECLPKIENHEVISDAKLIEIISGEVNKSIESVLKLWDFFQKNNASRSSLLINLGGGLIGDLGGFAASTFKRGFNFINIPTTLLSQVDASIGGKTGFNFGGLKNEIGVFNNPKYVLIDSKFLNTLESRQVLSGWAEMLKHAFIFNKKDWENLQLYNIKRITYKELNKLIERSVQIKKHFVENDPTENNIRKALNFGHTFGHAFESYFMKSENKLLHGEAVAHGMICELFLSNQQCNFPSNDLQDISNYLIGTYGKIKLQESDFIELVKLMTHDKKNKNKKINFTLLADFGDIKIDSNCSDEQIIEALNWYCSL